MLRSFYANTPINFNSFAPSNPPKTALSLAQHNVLASLVKGRWIDGKAQTSLCCTLLAIRPPFIFAKLFAVKTDEVLY